MINTRYSLCAGLVVSLGVFSVAAVADPVPLSSTVLNSNGVQIYTSVNVPAGNPTYPVSFSFGSGGGFTATIDSTNTAMWCVDAEEDISPPTTYNADIVEVSQIGNNSSDVRFGNVGSSGWALNLGPGYDTPQERFEMATYLVNQYPGLPGGPTPSNTTTDQELQTAIWEIMWNNSVTSESGITFSAIQNDGTNMSNVAADITAAQNFVNANPNASLFNNYAVISGGANANGSLITPGIQTYLVQLDAVPEPASVVLFGSLVGGVLALTKRTRSKRVRNVC